MADEHQFEVVFPESTRAVILVRCVDDPDPLWSIEGRAKCYRCLQWCWLGTSTFRLVIGAEALPLCHQCSDGLMTAESLVGMVNDGCSCGRPGCD